MTVSEGFFVLIFTTLIMSVVVCAAYGEEILGWFQKRKRRGRKARLRFSTRRRQRKLRKAGREAEEALRQFHNTKKRIRIESRRGWEDTYNELRDKLEPGMFTARRRHKAVDYYQGKAKGAGNNYIAVDNYLTKYWADDFSVKMDLIQKGIY